MSSQLLLDSKNSPVLVTGYKIEIIKKVVVLVR